MDILKVRDVKTPIRGTDLSAGIDFFIPNDFETIYLNPGKGINIPSGIHVKIPRGYALIDMNKSGIATRKNLIVGACVIDEDYRGEVHLHVINVGKERVLIRRGEKLLQALLIPVFYDYVEEVRSELERKEGESDIDFKGRVISDFYGNVKTKRGSGGFGSTGLK